MEIVWLLVLIHQQALTKDTKKERYFMHQRALSSAVLYGGSAKQAQHGQE